MMQEIRKNLRQKMLVYIDCMRGTLEDKEQETRTWTRESLEQRTRNKGGEQGQGIGNEDENIDMGSRMETRIETKMEMDGINYKLI